jgi:hypothetical protein
MNLDAYKKKEDAANKRSPGKGDATHSVDLLAAVGLAAASAFTTTGGWSLILAAVAVYHVFTIIAHDVALLWFDDLIADFKRQDPRVWSFRRLSVHVVMQVVEVILLFTVVYRWTNPERGFFDLFFASFSATMTLNYVEKMDLARWAWMLQIGTSVLIVVLVLAVVAGERHTRKEIANDPGRGWGKVE